MRSWGMAFLDVHDRDRLVPGAAGRRGRRLSAHLRTLRLLRHAQMLERLRQDSDFFRRNEEVVFAVTDLAVFIFVMTAVVYET